MAVYQLRNIFKKTIMRVSVIKVYDSLMGRMAKRARVALSA